MATIFDNASHTNATVSLAAGNSLIFGTASFWTQTGTIAIVSLAGNNLFRNAGQVYADAIAVSASGGGNRVEILASGIVSSSDNVAILMAGNSNSFNNGGYVAGDTAIQFTGGSNIVNNTGTLVASGNTVDFGPGAFTDRITNSGTIISDIDDAIEFEGTGLGVVNNSGLLSALRSTAILQNGSGALNITNSGTIVGQEAISAGNGADTVVNTGTIAGITLLGDGDDLFDSSAGLVNGAVNGDGGDDSLIGGNSGDRLNGGSGDDLLVGNGGNDRLAGGSGADDIDGGNGRDTATYEDSAAVTVDLANPDLNTGSAAGDTFTGIENLTGGFDTDQLFGDAQRNVLRGQAGGDTLDGRGGSDVLIGGLGDDVYIVDTTRDRVVELGGQGIDTVRSTATFTLSAEVENLTLIGTGANAATGNLLENLIVGNSAANVLNGLLGNDSLTGGGGADVFRFDSALNAATNVDTVNDFVVGTDRIELSRTIFTELNNGSALQPTRFFVGGAANDASDRIVYNATTGELFYDADGTGAIAQVPFAQIGAGLALTAADFQLIG